MIHGRMIWLNESDKIYRGLHGSLHQGRGFTVVRHPLAYSHFPCDLPAPLHSGLHGSVPDSVSKPCSPAI